MIEERGVWRSVPQNIGPIGEDPIEEGPTLPPRTLTAELYGPNCLSAYMETGQKQAILLLRGVSDECHLGFFTLTQLKEIVAVLEAAQAEPPTLQATV